MAASPGGIPAYRKARGLLSVDSAGFVYLGTSFDGAFVLRQNKWHRLAAHQLNRCACQSGHGLYIDPSDHNHVFFTTNDGGLLVTEDGGRSWRDGASTGTRHEPRAQWLSIRKSRGVSTRVPLPGGFSDREITANTGNVGASERALTTRPASRWIPWTIRCTSQPWTILALDQTESGRALTLGKRSPASTAPLELPPASS